MCTILNALRVCEVGVNEGKSLSRSELDVSLSLKCRKSQE